LRAAFDTASDKELPTWRSPAIEVTLMIHPSPVARSDGRAAWQQKRPDHVRRQHAVPVVDRERFDSSEGYRHGDAGVVDDTVHTRPPLEGGIDERPCGERPADIALHVHGVTQLGGQLLAGVDR
jgi:hypothetical protein